MTVGVDGECWDLVIGDHSMRQFGGLAALALVRERKLDIPFICVSGTITEDLAVNAMRAGANDWVTKGQLKRLLPPIERELREAKGRAALRPPEPTSPPPSQPPPIVIYPPSPDSPSLSVNPA